MTVYVISTILTGILLGIAQCFYKYANRYNNVNEPNRNYLILNTFHYVFLILSIIPLFLVSGLRYGVGTDYFYTYYPSFYQIMGGASPYTEKTFVWLNQLIILFTDDVTWLFLITALIFNLFLILSIKKMSNNWLVSGLMIVIGNFFFISMNNVRQACALSISIYAFSFACEKKIFRCLLLQGFALCFHLTSIVLLPVYVLVLIPKIKKVIIPILLGLIILTPTYIPICKFVLQNTEYIKYFEFEGKDNPLYQYLMVHSIVFLISMLNYKDITDNNKYAVGLIIVNVIALIISILSFQVKINETMTRAAFYFTWAIIFLAPMFLKATKVKVIGWFYVLIVISFAGFSTYYTSYYLGHHEVFPYISIFS